MYLNVSGVGPAFNTLKNSVMYLLNCFSVNTVGVFSCDTNPSAFYKIKIKINNNVNNNVNNIIYYLLYFFL